MSIFFTNSLRSFIPKQVLIYVSGAYSYVTLCMRCMCEIEKFLIQSLIKRAESH